MSGSSTRPSRPQGPTYSSAHLELRHLGPRELSHYDSTATDGGLLEPLATRRAAHIYSSDAVSKANTMPSCRVGTLSKLLLVPAVLVPLAVSALLLSAIRNHWYIAGPLLTFTTAHRGVVQAVVQIVSHVLGALQTYVLYNLIAFGVRIHLMSTYISLKKLKFFSAVVSHQFDLTLPRSLLFQLILFNLLNLAPSALWAASITPIITTSSSSGTMDVAHFDQDSAKYWGGVDGVCDLKTNVLGTFSNCPGLRTPNGLLATISTASTPTGAIRNHTKNDNTQFAYIGRSYGMGSSVGLVPLQPIEESPPLVERYTYTEYGYNSSVECIYNSSSNWHYAMIQQGKDGNGIPGIFYAAGYLPNSNLSVEPPFYSIVSWGDRGDDVVAYQSDDNMGRFMYAFTAGQTYPSLEKIQCEVFFTPCEYNVVVSLPGNITVTPAAQCGGTDVMDVDPTQLLRRKVVWELSWLPRVSTSLYRSLVGDGFMSNIHNFNISHHGDPNGTTLLAMGVSFKAAIDDTFAAISSNQVITNSTKPVIVNTTIKVLNFGDAWAIYAVLALSVFLLFTTTAEAVRTRFWTELPLFDFVDIKTCIVGAALGSSTVTKSIVANLGSDLWLGDGAEPRLDEIKVRLKIDATGMSLATDVRETPSTSPSFSALPSASRSSSTPPAACRSSSAPSTAFC